MEIIQPNTTAILKCDSILVPKPVVKEQTIAIQCVLPEDNHVAAKTTETGTDTIMVVICLAALFWTIGSAAGFFVYLRKD